MTSSNPSRVYRRPESVLVVVYAPNHRILLLERSHPEGYWQSVTGSLEPGEVACDTARRELFEETGLDAVPHFTGVVNQFEIMPQWRARYAPEIKSNTEYVFTVAIEAEFEPSLNPQEHTQFAWLDAKTAINWCFSETNAEAIKQIVLNKAKNIR